MSETRKPSTVKTSRIVRIFWNAAKEYPFLIFVIALCSIVNNVLSAVAPIYYKRFFDVIAVGGQNLEPAAFRLALTALIMALLLKFVQWALWRPTIFLSNKVEASIMAKLSNNAFSSLIHHSYTFFTNSFVGTLTRRVNKFSNAFENIFDQMIFSLIPLFVSTASILFVIFFRSFQIGMIVLVWVVILLYANYLAIKWKQRYEEERSEADSRLSGTLSDSITNSATIKLFSAFTHEQGLFGAAVERVRKIRLFTWNVDEVIRAVQGLLGLLIEVAVMFGTLQLFRAESLTIGDFILFQTYLLTLSGNLWNFGNILKGFYRSFAEAKEMVEILDQPYDIQDIPGAKKLLVKEGKIEFNDVLFSFNETRNVLEHFSLTIAPHEKVAFVGTSGAGKTTITKLLFRFYDLTGGHILIDGQDIAKVTQESLRDAIALVPQEPILFHRSLKDNIKYGRRDASDEEAIEAAKKAHCHEFISSLPEGYDTLVGERGVKLSGGERQRVAIARAILKNAPILVLDEATSSLDSESEHLIQDALRTLMAGKTVIVIAHRLSTISTMDRIIVVENGTIRAAGTHDELRTKDELYKKLWSIQAGGFLTEANS